MKRIVNAICIALSGAYFMPHLQYAMVKEVIAMRFEVQPNRKESENKTIRFPLPLIERINQAITGKDVSFSSFVIQACAFALDNMTAENTENASRE